MATTHRHKAKESYPQATGYTTEVCTCGYERTTYWPVNHGEGVEHERPSRWYRPERTTRQEA